MGNSNFRFGGKVLLFDSFSESGIKKVKVVWNIDTNSFKSSLVIFYKLNDKKNWIAQYSQIKEAFKPKHKKYDNVNIVKKKVPFELNNTELI